MNENYRHNEFGSDLFSLLTPFAREEMALRYSAWPEEKQEMFASTWCQRCQPQQDPKEFRRLLNELGRLNGLLNEKEEKMALCDSPKPQLFNEIDELDGQLNALHHELDKFVPRNF